MFIRLGNNMIEAADQLFTKIRAYDSSVDEDRFRRAFVFGMEAHDGQTRASGDPYYTHPIAVANLLADMQLDLDTVITALLHDTVEDCEVSLTALDNEFGSSVSQLVDGVTKLSLIGRQTGENLLQAENFRKLLLAMSEDVRVLLIKLADRAHNMHTISHIPKQEKRARIARETLDIYAPLAELIGVTNLQHSLEDKAFAVLHQEMAQTISARLEFMVQESEIVIPMISVELQDVVERGGVECSVNGRLKSAYSIWRKMQRKKVTMDQLSDIMAFRVLVPSSEDCYRALGCVHAAYPNVMGRIKDYISTPKRNGYQSIHTGVIGPENHKIEIQVRTPEMHSVAEYGVAAHWDYKTNIFDKNMFKFKWIEELVGILDEEAGAEEFLEHTKMDLYHDQVFCFTPRGDLIALPKGATAVDFAYAVHSKVGEKCCGVRINGKNRQLATELENGDKIEIVTKSSAKPLAEWENFVKTGRAKSGIRRAVRAERAVEFSRVGRSMLQKAFSENNKRLQKRVLNKIPQLFNVQKMEDIFAQIGEGRLQPGLVLEKLYPDLAKSKKRTKSAGEGSRAKTKKNKPLLTIQGVNSGVAITTARCCHPLPGEEIVGIFTTGKGVTVHRVDCATLVDFNDMPELWMDVGWEHEGPRRVLGRLNTVLSNEPGALAAVATIIGQQGGNISDIHLTDRSADFFSFKLDLEVKDVEHMRTIIAVLQANNFVESVERSSTVKV
ncbi:bifunctional (p)ppGpp synthetase/guanosine-3',5'-bis(diphosphate) 3'-pyrophosphohydrolase [Candidatus Puniceispirillum sp.]|nr:bifunctional (p)ppGpp synthetase/guanosine-3',5'-bis(diphosphate) 3'-pyrophosphohydrolase [Candidatus Puniceispirillum sp.]